MAVPQVYPVQLSFDDLTATLTKRCHACGIEKPLDSFSMNRASKDGLVSRCKVCASGAWAAYYRVHRVRHLARRKAYTASHKEAIAAYQRQRQQDPAYRVKKAQWDKAYRLRHRDEINARRRPKICLARTQYRERHRRWRMADPTKHRANGRRREYCERASRELYGHHTEVEWQTKLAEYGGRCAWCGSAKNITRDHVIPLSKGGSDLIANIQPLCKSCNSSKGARLA